MYGSRLLGSVYGSMLGSVTSVCGSRKEAMHENENILNSLAAVIHKNKRNVAGRQ